MLILGGISISQYSTIEKLQLLSDYQDLDYSVKVFSDYHAVRAANMTKWIKQFLLGGLAGIMRPKHNRRYSLELKLAAIKDYQKGVMTNKQILGKCGIRNISQLHQWVIRYNEGTLHVTKQTGKRVRIMGRKVTFEEKQAIVQWTIAHQNNYQAAVEKFDVSYQRFYSWVRKYQRTYDWESLRDNRGRNKGKEPTIELERLRQ